MSSQHPVGSSSASNATANIETEGLGTATSTRLAATGNVRSSSAAGVDAEVTMSSQNPVRSSSASVVELESDPLVVNATDQRSVNATHGANSTKTQDSIGQGNAIACLRLFAAVTGNSFSSYNFYFADDLPDKHPKSKHYI